MTSAELTAPLLLCTAMSFTPGPNNNLSTVLAANFGLKRALRFVLSAALCWGLLLGLCTSGMGALVVNLPPLALGHHGLRWFDRSMATVLVATAAWMLTLLKKHPSSPFQTYIFNY